VSPFAEGLDRLLMEIIEGNCMWYAGLALLLCEIAASVLRVLLRRE
jgi:hypothetical protein